MAKRAARRRTNTGLPVYVWAGGLVGILLIVAGLIFLTERQGTNPNPATLPYPGVPRVSPAEAHGQQQAGTGVIIDVRGTQLYQEAHAAGALSVPEDELLARIGELPTDKNLIFY